MRWRSAATFSLASAALFKASLGQVITITEFASACSAVYTTGSQSVTVVQSTVTVQPQPWTDTAANSGTPFVLQVLPASGPTRKRQSSVWLTANGNTTTSSSLATQYQITNGRLSGVTASGYLSTNPLIPSQPLALSNTIGSIDTNFTVQGSVLNWTSSNFAGGIADFYSLGNEVVARFVASTSSGGWTPVVLYAMPVSSAGQLTSSASQSTSVVTNIVTGSTSSALSPGGTSKSAATAASAPSMTSAATPSATNISPNQLCGSTNNGFTCAGSAFGNCCSEMGYCGSGDAFCGTGCQTAYGECYAIPPSSMSMGASSSMNMAASSTTGMPFSSLQSGPGPVSIPNGPTSSMPMPASMSMTGMTTGLPSGPSPMASGTTSSTSSSASPIPTFTCPGNADQNVTDTNGIEYNLGCFEDTLPNAYGSASVSQSFDQCFALCDAEPHCTAFTYTGGTDGVGGGTCYFKDGPAVFSGGYTYLVGAIRLTPFPSTSSSSSMTLATFSSAAQPIGPLHPTGYNSSAPLYPTVTSSTAMSSSSTSAQPISPSGECGTVGNGGSPNGYTCTGSVFGMCCSSSGYCGNSTEYCLAGCQSAFGSCTAQRGDQITVSGECGVNYGNQTCTGGNFGPCCSTSGYCGSTDAYCAPANCNPMFGTCPGSSSTTTAMMSTTSSMTSAMMSTSSSMTTAMTSTSSSTTTAMMYTSSSPTAAQPSTCPAVNGTTTTDSFGNVYELLCNVDTVDTSYNYTYEPSMAVCVQQCGEQPGCKAVTFNGVICYFKNSYSGQVSSPGAELAVLQSALQPSSSSGAVTHSTSTMMSTSSSSSSSMAMGSSSTTAMTSSSTTKTSSSTAYSSSASSTATMLGSSSISTSSSSTSIYAIPTQSQKPPPSYACPGISGQTVSDQYGNEYIVECSDDTTGEAYSSPGATTSWTDCFTACASMNSGIECTAFTYSGGANGNGQGICFLKSNSVEYFTSTGDNLLVAAINVNYYNASDNQVSAPTASPTSGANGSTPVVVTASTATTYLELTSPMACSFGDPAGTDEDDAYCSIELPFQMTMYDQSGDVAYASTNGLLSILSGSVEYQPASLPDPNIPNNTVAGFFDDLYIYGNSTPQQGIFYQFNNDLTNITFEYYLSRAGSGQIYHWTVGYSIHTPGVYTIEYLQTGGETDDGYFAAVGTQGVDVARTELGYTYSFNTSDIMPGLILQCNTNANTCAEQSGSLTGKFL